MVRAIRFLSSKHSGLFSRVLVALCAVLVPLYVLGIFIYLSGTDAVKKRLLQEERFRVQSVAKRLEQEIEHTETLQRDYIENYRLRFTAIASSIMSTYDLIQAILSIQDALALLCGASPIISDATVSFPTLGRSVTRRGTDRLTREQMEALRAQWGSFEFNPERLALDVPYPPNHATTGIQYVLSISFDAQRISALLSDSLRSFSGRVFLIGANGRVLFSSVRDDGAGRNVVAVLQGMRGADSIQTVDKVGTIDSLITTAKVSFFGGSVVSMTPVNEVLGPLLGYRNWFWALTTLTVILGGLFSAWISSAVRRPLARLVEGFRQVEMGNLSIALKVERKDEFGYLHDHFNAMIRSLDSTMRRCVEQETLARHAELLQLQYQINPHFLYNSIYHIYRMAKAEDYESIERYALHLGSYYEYITRSEVEEAFLEEEAEQARNYAEVQRIRFSNRIKVNLAPVPDRISRLSVPRLIIQPVLENAFNHGLKNVVANGVLTVRYLDLDELAIVTVEDNGNGMTDGEIERIKTILRDSESGSISKMTGIVNIHRRLILRFGSEGGVRVCHSELGGLKVSLLIPNQRVG